MTRSFRGTTSKKLVQALRDAGAIEVHMRISSPPVTHPCFYGIDTDTQDQLIAARLTLQSNFGAILLALVDGRPQQLTLLQLLQTFLDYRELTIIRRTNHALRKTEDRLEVVEGLTTALASLQQVIAMIQEARDAAKARASLMVHFDLSERQADAVLAMPLAGSQVWNRKACVRRQTIFGQKDSDSPCCWKTATNCLMP